MASKLSHQSKRVILAGDISLINNRRSKITTERVRLTTEGIGVTTEENRLTTKGAGVLIEIVCLTQKEFYQPQNEDNDNQLSPTCTLLSELVQSETRTTCTYI